MEITSRPLALANVTTIPAQIPYGMRGLREKLTMANTPPWAEAGCMANTLLLGCWEAKYSFLQHVRVSSGNKS